MPTLPVRGGLPQETFRKTSILDDINLSPEQIKGMTDLIERNTKCDSCGGDVKANYETKEVICKECGNKLK